MPDLIQSPPQSTLDSVQQPVSLMIDQVASLIGGGDNLEARQQSLIWLDRAVDRLNMAGVFSFQQKEKTFSAAEGTAVTDGDTTLTKPADFGWPMDFALVYDSDGGILKRMTWRTWDTFKILLNDESNTAIPEYLSMRSPITDEIYIAPAADTNSFTSIVLPYWARVQRLSENMEITMVPEVREALISGGEFFAMRDRYKARPNFYLPFQKDFENTIAGAHRASQRWLASTMQAFYPDLDGYAMPMPDQFVQPPFTYVVKYP